MKDIAIIGGGISGLTAAYYASKKGMKTSLFEESLLPGGRLEYCISLTTSDFQPVLYDFVFKELDLSGIEVPFLPSFIGMLAGDQIMGFEKLPEMLQQLPQDQGEYFGKIMGEAVQSRFDPENPSENLIRLRNISFAEYLKDCPPQLLEMMIKPTLAFTFMKEIDLKKLSAEYGLFSLRFTQEMGKETVQTFEEGIRFLADILADKIRKQGTDLHFSSRVTEVKKTKSGFLVRYNYQGEEKTEEAAKIIVAIPFKGAKEIIPELDTGEGIYCEKTKYFSVKGKLKSKRKMLIGFPGNKANLRLLFIAYPDHHYVYPWDIERPVDFGFLYKSHEVFEEKEIEDSFYFISPNARIPQLKSNLENVYLCGDFLYYPMIETSIRTAQKVVELIEKE